MKRVFSLFLSLVLVLGISVNGIAQSEVSDTNKTPDFVEALNERGIISGYDDGSFGLDQEITRAEFAAIAVRMLDLEALAKSSSYTSHFKDVEAAKWYTGYINVAAGKGLLKGYEDNTFRPDKKITLAEAVTIVVRIVDGDILVGNWPTNYLVRASEIGIYEDIKMAEAKAPSKRGVVFRLVYNAMFHDTEDTRIVSPVVKGLVIENDRVENIDSGKVIIRLLDSFGESKSNIKGGMEFEYILKKNEDPEVFLGKIVEVDFQGEKIKSIRIDPNYDYLTGRVEDISKNSITIGDKKYTVQKEDRFVGGSTNKIYQVYVNGEDVSYEEFLDYDELQFAKVTVSNGKVLFIDAYDIDEIGPIDYVKNDKVEVRLDKIEGASDSVDLDDIFVLDFVKNGDYYDLKRSSSAGIKIGDMLYYEEDAYAIVDRQAKVVGKLENVSISKRKITVNGNEYEISFEDEPIGNCIYSENGIQYETLDEEDFDERINESFGKNINISLDIYGKVQSISASIDLDTGVFALVNDLFVDEIEVKDSNNSKKTYDIDLDTEFYKVDLEDLYEDEDDFEELEGSLSENMKELKGLIDDAEQDALVYLQLNGKVVKSLTFVDMEDAWFRTKRVKDDYIVVQDPVDEKYYEFDDYDFEDSRVIVLGTNIQGMTPEYFLKRYAVNDKYPLDAALIPYKNIDTRVRYLFAKPSGNSDGVRTKEIIRKVVDIDLGDEADYIELESPSGNVKKHKIADARVAKMADEDELEVGDAILGEVIYNDAKDIVKARILIEEDTEFVYKVIEVNSSSLVLGFNESVNTDIDEFDSDNKFEVEFSSDHEEFGDIEEGNFVTIHYDKDQNVDVIMEVEEPNELAEGGKTYFAEVEIVNMVFGFKKVFVTSSPVGKYYKIKDRTNYEKIGEKEIATRVSDEFIEIYILDEGLDEIGEIKIRLDRTNEKAYPIEMYD